MHEPQQLGPKEVSHEPIVLRCGEPRWVVTPVRFYGDIPIEVCPVVHQGLVAVQIDGQTVWGTIPSVTSDGKQCLFFSAGRFKGWFATQEMQRWNKDLQLQNVPGDGSLGVRGWIACISAAMLFVLVQRGCSNGPRLVSPALSEPAVGQKE